MERHKKFMIAIAIVFGIAAVALAGIVLFAGMPWWLAVLCYVVFIAAFFITAGKSAHAQSLLADSSDLSETE